MANNWRTTDKKIVDVLIASVFQVISPDSKAADRERKGEDRRG